MDTQNAIYRLRRFYDDPRFKGFSQKVFGDLPDPWPQKRESRRWRMYRFAKWWKPMKAVGSVRPFNDYPCFSDRPAFSQRAVDALRNLLEPNGEILPLSTPLGSYYFFNCTTIADVLNWKKSDVRWHYESKPYSAILINRYEFFPKKLGSLVIFVLPELPHEIYVTDVFVERVRRHGLNGFNFEKVWPLPPGVKWGDLAKIQKAEQIKRGLPAGQTINGNTLVIELNLADAKSGGSKTKLAQIKKLKAQLDARLDSHSFTPVGVREGDFGKGGKHQILLSCPDASALADKLSPLLKKFGWKNGLTVKKYSKPMEAIKSLWD